MSKVHKKVKTPVGELTLVASDKGLAAILWENEKHRTNTDIGCEDDRHPLLLETERQLREYFAGKRDTFSIALDFDGTKFQKSVWNALLTIPYGETRSYAQIARQVGNARAMRAVGAANGRNPIPIIAPCHRVIGASGKLVGFGGGLRNKATLLDLEATKERRHLAGSAR
jgi:methylated-DNA-[protein]-cysteine S-methyltransferase